VAANATAGAFSVPLTATSGTLQRSATLQLTLGKRANVSLVVPTQRVDVAQGASAVTNILVNTDGGVVDFNVHLQASVPGGTVATFSSTSVSPSAQVALTLASSVSAPTGPGTVTILATRSVDGAQVSASFPVYVDPQSGTIPGDRSNWVRMGSNPIAVYYDAPRNHVLASLPAMNKVQVIDAGTGNLVTSIPVSVANYEPNGVWLASSSNLSSTLDGRSLLVLGSGHVAKIDLASAVVTSQQALPQAIPIGWTTPNPILPTFLTAASGGHMVFGSWGDSSFYNWDGVSPLATLHSISDLYSFDRSFDGTKVLVASGDSSGAYQLLDIASDTISLQGNYYPDATIMTVRGNPARSEWAIANSNGIDFLDANLNRIANVRATLLGSITYWGMTYSADGKYLYFVYSPAGLPFLITVDDSTHQVVGIAPATGTTLAYYRRAPPEWIVQPFAADSSGLVFGLGQKGLVIDDSTHNVDPTQATRADYAIIATPDNGPLSGSSSVQITTQSYSAQPDVWFGTRRAVAQSLNPAGQVSATTPSASSVGAVNIKLFAPDGYPHVIPQAFTYGTVITSVRYSLCSSSGGCSADIFGFGLFGSNSSQTTVTIGGNTAPIQSTNYFNADQPYPYPLQYLRVTVPPGLAGPANISVKTASGQATLPNGFLYASSLQTYPSSQTYNALLFDKKRGILYASTNSGISRFSASSSSFVTPITPPSITGQSMFEAMSLTPDGSRLIVANKQDGSVAVIDPDNPTTATAIAVPGSVPNAAGPVFVAATSTGKVLISVGGFVEPWVGPLYELDLASSQVQPLVIPGVFTGDGPRLSPTTDGSAILIRGYGGAIGLWRASTRQFLPLADNFAGSGLGTAAGDGNLFAVGLGLIAPDGTSTIGMDIPDELGGFQGFFPNDAALNDSGSLEFAPAAGASSLFIIDTHHGEALRSIALPNPVNVWTKVIAVDTNAEHVFLSDSQGLTVLSLAAAPLTVGSISPSVVATSGGTIVKIRGSGFQPGSAVTIGGVPASAVFVDENTLQVTVPTKAAGAAQLIVQNPNGESYVLDAAVFYK
jgi:IPT/TIG domain